MHFPASMWFHSSSSCPPIALVFTLYFLQLISMHIAATDTRLNNSSISAVFVFGDSTVDSGNNNYIKTIARSNFPPYGKDFPNHIPTGRFTNGRLVTDFAAAYVGVKDLIPPYLDPKLSLEDLITGVCFASAGSGFDPLTAAILSNVISMEKQLNNFKEYKARLEQNIGKNRTESVINKALFLISAGTNDFIANYYLLPIRRLTYTVSGYQLFLLQRVQQFIEGLLELGARKIGFVGLPPIGCVPAVITFYSGNVFTRRGCIESLSSVAKDYNRMLQEKITAIQKHGATIRYIDVYKSLDDIIKNPRHYGFENVDRGCCGSGLIEGAFLCNLGSKLCSDASKYVFWDSVHPTEATYYKVFNSIRPILDVFLNNN